MVDVVLEPKGFEGGYRDLVGSAVMVDVEGTTIRVGALADLITSKRLLDREKDREHIPLLQRRVAELAAEKSREPGHGPEGPDRGTDRGIDIGF
jgi:hypothetical protein